MSRSVAFVTGASRGIGRASALALARAGFDVAITARTVREGEGRVETPYSDGSAAAPVAVTGSLETTAAEIEAEGAQALSVEMGMLGLAHCASKGAFHRIAPILQAEHAKDGIRAINLDPGFTQTETMTALGLPTLGAATPDVTGAVVAWLATHPEEAQWDGRTVDTHALCAELELVAGWPPPGS